ARSDDANKPLQSHIDRPHVLRTLVFYGKPFRALRDRKTRAMSHWRPNIQQLRDDRERLTREHQQIENWTSFSSTPFLRQGRPVPTNDFTNDTSVALMLPFAFTSQRKVVGSTGCPSR